MRRLLGLMRGSFKREGNRVLAHDTQMLGICPRFGARHARGRAGEGEGGGTRHQVPVLIIAVALDHPHLRLAAVAVFAVSITVTHTGHPPQKKPKIRYASPYSSTVKIICQFISP